MVDLFNSTRNIQRLDKRISSKIEDGDIVSLYFNGEWILKEHKLWHEVQIVNIKLDAEKENELIVYAHNEGKRPPNTVAMIIFDKKGKRNIR